MAGPEVNSPAVSASETIVKGALYIVATPIGNLKDMGLRAIDVLTGVDLIAAEDTRHSSRLLQHYSIKTHCISLHEFNERERASNLIDQLKSGKSIALISDAGTPLISDPGYPLVSTASQAGIRIIPIPGPSAILAAISASGLPCDRFTFEGFLPPKAAQRKERLESLAEESRTMVFYESPRRIQATLRSMEQVFGASRPAVLGRELTKLYETISRDSLGGLLEMQSGENKEHRGEYVVIVQGTADRTKETVSCAVSEVLSTLLQELPVKQAVALASAITGHRKNALYEMALKQGEQG